MKKIICIVVAVVVFAACAIPSLAFEYEFDPDHKIVRWNSAADMDEGSFVFASGSYEGGFQGNIYYLQTNGLNGEFKADLRDISYSFRSHGIRTFVRPDYDADFDPLYLDSFDFDFEGIDVLPWEIYSGVILGTGITGTQRIGSGYTFYQFQHDLGYGVYILPPNLSIWQIDRKTGAWSLIDTSGYGVDLYIHSTDNSSADEYIARWTPQQFYDQIKHYRSGNIANRYPGYSVTYQISKINGDSDTPSGIPLSKNYDYCVQVAFNQYATVQPPLRDFVSFVGYVRIARYQRVYLSGYLDTFDALSNPDFRDWLQMHPEYIPRYEIGFDYDLGAEMSLLFSPLFDDSHAITLFGLTFEPIHLIVSICSTLLIGTFIVVVLHGRGS